MAIQGTTTEFMELLLAMKKDGKLLAPPGKLLFIFDMPGSYQKAIGMIFDDPNYTKGGMDAPLS